ncbi:hypothetical protein EVAR_45780_1 [Eumeta japonica]|uniref:Uncharacterized protein n=1 Tax=Eumeta variegata TaxID=151549 RepID=A0A4C1X453_EUMVA|nr:hypothetical protein EVAR_45780_1 [Eumeta japonica]
MKDQFLTRVKLNNPLCASGSTSSQAQGLRRLHRPDEDHCQYPLPTGPWAGSNSFTLECSGTPLMVDHSKLLPYVAERYSGRMPTIKTVLMVCPASGTMTKISGRNEVEQLFRALYEKPNPSM